MPSPPSSVIRARLSASERDLRRAAAKSAGTSRGDFVRCRAIEAAELDVIANPVATISARDWAAFDAWTDARTGDNPALRALLARRPAWQD